MKRYETNKLHIKSWCNDLEGGALQQACNIAELPFAFHHIALMPDCHQGYGMPIGGVMAAKGVIVPNAVGVDIGCGMSAINTGIKDIPTDVLKDIIGRIRKVIPVGFNHQQKAQRMPCDVGSTTNMPIVQLQYKSATKQLGTLGGGNHFIEIQKESNGNIWIMIHSGSRNLGLQVAKHYNKLAIEINAKYYSKVDKSQELAFLPLNSVTAQLYISEMDYCVKFASANRKLMMERIIEILINLNFYKDNSLGLSDARDSLINIAHNYARMEHHFGTDVMIHRKGATSAAKSVIGIIPGSQGTKSYIIKGKENPDSFNSCSHGAGRKMGRKVAIMLLNLNDEKAILDRQGIIHSIRNESDLDEASSAYKDISTVMDEQKDLIEIITELTPLAVIKG